MQTIFKKVPFDIELAKKITNKKVKGRVVTRYGSQVRIICFDKDGEHNDYPIIALIKIAPQDERIFTFSKKGVYNIGHTSNNDIMLEVPTYYRDYSNFVPEKYQSCLVRNQKDDYWKVRVCSSNKPTVMFYDIDGYCNSYNEWNFKLPLSKITEYLKGTKKSYEELIEELDKNYK